MVTTFGTALMHLAQNYSSLFSTNLICFTMVLFPDSPAPEIVKKIHIKYWPHNKLNTAKVKIKQRKITEPMYAMF